MRVFFQRDLLLTSLGVRHRRLLASANREVVYGVERLLQIAHHVSERPALTVRKEIVTGYSQFGHSVPLWCMCRSQTAQRQGKDPSNGAIQNGYIDILRLPRRITITRVATMPGAIMTPILPGRMDYTGYPQTRSAPTAGVSSDEIVVFQFFLLLIDFLVLFVFQFFDLRAPPLTGQLV